MEQHMRLKHVLSLSFQLALQNTMPDNQPKLPQMPEGTALPDFHQIAYLERGDSQNDHIICVHGIARNARDFDFLAERLSRRACVICPDVIGRGRSDWLCDPDIFFGYTYAQYMMDATALIARLGVPEVDWVGTSLGGLLGMMMAAAPRSPVRRLVMNDVGPRVSTDLSRLLVNYLAQEHTFPSPDYKDLQEFMRKNYSGVNKFGILTEAQLRHMAKYSERKRRDGKVGLAFDHETMRVLKQMRDNNQLKDLEYWNVWQRVRCPVLVLRGANSPALDKATAKRMRTEGPRACIVTIPDCGHAPSLMSEGQIALVDTWLQTMEIDQKSVAKLIPGATLEC